EKSEKLKKERIYDNKADDGIYWTDDGINKKEGKLNYFEDKFSTLQASNRRVKGRQTGFQEKIHKTRSFNNDELPRLIEQNQYEELRRALLEVQRDLDSAQEYKRRNNNAEVERIENVILSISERIQHPNEPVSKAQAEAKEELLRVRLARMILNLDPDFEPKQKNIKKDNNDLSNENVFADIALESYYVRALREPIGLLREKLALLEHRLLSEQQLEINDQLIRIGLTPPPLRNLEQKLRKESLSQRSDEISRMTPLIVMLRHKLNALDDLCHKEQIKADTTNISGRLTPYEERKIVFDLLVRINTEIDTIHKLCREENVKERIEIVLKKVSSSIDKIMETLKNMSASTTIATSRQPSTSSLSETKRNISNVDRPIIYQKQIDNQSSKLEQAILNKQKQQKGNIIQNQTKQTFLQRMKEKQSEKAEINKNKQFFEFPENIYSKHSKFYKQDNISLKSFDEEHESQTSRKKTPPQVPPKRKSLTSSIEERIGPLYSIIEENPSTSKQTNISKQRVNAVELSAHLDRPYESTSRVNAFIPLLTTRTATRIESPPLSPASVAKQPSLEISKNLSSDLAHSSKGFKDKSPFRLGPCPTSYLTREQQCQQQRITIGQKPSRIW
uniref:DUF4200 domain-containing protein n=1 Tax=Meloidogyne hapla TaxID=6305 RepID=A0A1I8BHT0_MELHA